MANRLMMMMMKSKAPLNKFYKEIEIILNY